GTWDGVRNYQARNNLAAMQVGDAAARSSTRKRAYGPGGIRAP
ncbi:MAG: EVE domain-containing protein, partial [Pseudarthrobacter sp.]